MDKGKLHHFYVKFFKKIRPSYLILIAVILIVVAVFALRSNNEHMIALRDQVYAADKINGDVSGALNDLQAYVTSHMNTSLTTATGVYPPIQLKYTYQRLVSAQAAQVSATNSGLYTAAENYCQKVIPEGTTAFGGGPRVPCIEQYVSSHGATISSIDPSLYEFDFVSPTWSPDLAGYSLLLSGLFFVVGIILLISKLIVKRLIK